MPKKLSCRQIDALLGFYADGTIHSLLKKCVEEHLQNCQECRLKYEKIIEILKSQTRNITNQPEIVQYESKQYKDFKHNLSAYIDNELNDSESIKIKKFAISNSFARKDLENILQFKKLLHDSFEKTKNDIKYDFSKGITAQIQQELKMNNNNPIYKIAVLFFIMLSAIIIGFITLLNF